LQTFPHGCLGTPVIRLQCAQIVRIGKTACCLGAKDSDTSPRGALERAACILLRPMRLLQRLSGFLQMSAQLLVCDTLQIHCKLQYSGSAFRFKAQALNSNNNFPV
jgi:hypothetical protein